MLRITQTTPNVSLSRINLTPVGRHGAVIVEQSCYESCWSAAHHVRFKLNFPARISRFIQPPSLSSNTWPSHGPSDGAMNPLLPSRFSSIYHSPLCWLLLKKWVKFCVFTRATVLDFLIFSLPSIFFLSPYITRIVSCFSILSSSTLSCFQTFRRGGHPRWR